MISSLSARKPSIIGRHVLNSVVSVMEEHGRSRVVSPDNLGRHIFGMSGEARGRWDLVIWIVGVKVSYPHLYSFNLTSGSR